MEKLLQNCAAHLRMLCSQISDRSVGSEGNRVATRYFETITASLGWNTVVDEFEAMDWMDGGASLTSDTDRFQVYASPYSLECKVEEELIGVSSIVELERSTHDRKNITSTWRHRQRTAHAQEFCVLQSRGTPANHCPT